MTAAPIGLALATRPSLVAAESTSPRSVLSAVLPYLAIIASVLILAVVLRFYAEPNEPDNAVVHTQEDGKRDGETGPDDKPPDGPDDVALDDPARMRLAA